MSSDQSTPPTPTTEQTAKSMQSNTTATISVE
jgi:hypothetical protein